MFKLLHRKLNAFRREDGSAVVEFALWFPMFVMLLGACAELGMIAARHTMLERSLELAVRQVKIRTNNVPQFDELKQIICDEAIMIPDCMSNLSLEMRPQNMRQWQNLPKDADCNDRSEEVRPARMYIAGKQNELMILRACAKFSPIFPTTALGASLSLDGAGDYALVSMSAYVQEPR